MFWCWGQRIFNAQDNGTRLVLMHQSIPAAPSDPPPPPGYCRAFVRFVSPGGGAFSNFVLPGAGHLPNPRPFQRFWHARGFLSEYNYTENINGKKADWPYCQGQGVVKTTRFYACISWLFIKPVSSQNYIAKLGSYRRESRFFGQWINFCSYYLKNILSYL